MSPLEKQLRSAPTWSATTLTRSSSSFSSRNKKTDHVDNDKSDHDESLHLTSSIESTATTAVASGGTRRPRRGDFSTAATTASSEVSSSNNDHRADGGGVRSEPDEGDPLLALFHVHNSHRVQFDLSPRERDERVGARDDDGNADDDCGRKKKEPKFNIQKFVQSSLFHHGNASNSLTSALTSSSSSSSTTSCLIHSKASLDMEEERIVNKLSLGRRQTSFGRVGSFLRSVRGGSGSGSESVKAYMDFIEDKERLGVTGDTIHNSGDERSRGNKPIHSPSSMSSRQRIGMYLRKAQRAHHTTHRYRLAMKYYLLALKEYRLYNNDKDANNNNNNNNDAFATHVLKCLNDVHHAQTTLQNSASIVEMGIRHEDRNEYVKALKMYTVAYRMRRDSLGEHHASLPVLLNMMGSVQIKRGEYDEALEIYMLGLKWKGRRRRTITNEDERDGDDTEEKDDGDKSEEPTNGVFYDMNPLTTSVTLRDMGMIFEHSGKEERALRFYHASLRYAVKYMKQREVALIKLNSRRGLLGGEDEDSTARFGADGSTVGDDSRDGFKVEMMEKELANNEDTSTDSFLDNIDAHVDEPFSLDEIRIVKSTSIDKSLTNPPSSRKGEQPSVVPECESGDMEIFLEKRYDRWAFSQEIAKSASTKFYYDDLFLKPPSQAVAAQPNTAVRIGNGEGAEVDIAMTLHQIGQIHRRSHRYAAALSAYNASLRGMKQVFGSEHAHIAAILGNIGNLYMETGDNDEAFAIYQEVLGIETLHLGLSHPEIAVTLHNIATIECSRGNFAEGISLYKQVVEMQKIRFGQNHLTVAVTLGCLADAYERMRNIEKAMKIYEEALKIRMGVLTKYHLDVGRLMHKLGRLASSRKDYVTAMGHVKRAIEIYTINDLPPNHLFLREMARDYADIRAGLAFETMWPYFHLDDHLDSIFDC
ncbi:hypothetical protein ACHAW6_007514 [Cyclotella cf. meneghiniana]